MISAASSPPSLPRDSSVDSPIRQWLALRIRLLCIVVFVLGSILPPYVPKEAFANPDEALSSLASTPQFLLVEDGFLMKTSAITDQSARRPYAQGILHTVIAGENIAKLAERYGLQPQTIRWANTLPDGATITPGQQLLILPVDGVLHTVTRGQTLERISDLYDVEPSLIALQNNLRGTMLVSGMELIIPGGKPVVGKPSTIAAAPRFNPNLPAAVPSLPKPPYLAPATAQTHGILQMPCGDCFYTQYYRPGHYAVDIFQRGGGPIYAAEDGTVLRAESGWNGGYGNVIEIDHGNGLVTLYGHNKELYVKTGDRVVRGQKIAWMGNSGRVYGATGIHTHFEVRVNGVKKNPLLYLQ